MDMDVYRTRVSRGHQKDFRCVDCGHSYLIAQEQQSSICAKCGNIAFHGHEAQPLRDLATPAAERLSKILRSDDRRTVLDPARTTEKSESKEPTFAAEADGNKVREIMTRYQVEWQLWAVLLDNFADPNYHYAYFTTAAVSGNFSAAMARYSEHRNVMMLERENQWQAEIAEMMMAKLNTVAGVQVEREIASMSGFKKLLYLVPIQHARVARFFWLVLGLYIALKIFVR